MTILNVFYYFSDKITFDISCFMLYHPDPNEWQTIYMNSQTLFFLEKKNQKTRQLLL